MILGRPTMHEPGISSFRAIVKGISFLRYE
jgi:hypothetical protein